MKLPSFVVDMERVLSRISFPKIAMPNISLPDFGPVMRLTQSRWIEIAQSISESVKRLDRDLASLEPEAKALGEKGWTIPLLADFSIIRSIVEQASRERLDLVFIRYYAEEMGGETRALFEALSTSEALSHWQPLIKQAISSYKKRQYLLVVPSLLLVFEGALAKVGATFDRKPDSKGVSTRKRSAAQATIERLIWISLEGFVHEVFRNHEFNRTPPLRINRHWIMHGRAQPNWNRADCLRLFQAIHTLTG